MRIFLSSVGAVIRRELRHRSHYSIGMFLVLACVAIASGEFAVAGSNELEARNLFVHFVAAQNAHDLSEVKSMLWNSPDMLFFSRGVEVRGAETAADRFKEYYEGTWHLEPDMSKFHVTALSSDVVQILVPIAFTRGLRDAQPQTSTFLISQTLIRGAQGWRVASILPIANTQLK